MVLQRPLRLKKLWDGEKETTRRNGLSGVVPEAQRCDCDEGWFVVVVDG